MNNTNAVESQFRVVKHFERVLFGQKTPTLSEFIPAIGKIIQQQFRNRQIRCDNKRLVIFHESPKFQEALESASWKLNPLGLSVFHQAILMYEKKKANMTCENGVLYEKYTGRKSNGYIGEYNTCLLYTSDAADE